MTYKPSLFSVIWRAIYVFILAMGTICITQRAMAQQNIVININGQAIENSMRETHDVLFTKPFSIIGYNQGMATDCSASSGTDSLYVKVAYSFGYFYASVSLNGGSSEQFMTLTYSSSEIERTLRASDGLFTWKRNRYVVTVLVTDFYNKDPYKIDGKIIIAKVRSQSSGTDADELTKWANMLEKGLITREEFNQKKQDIMAR